MTSYHLDPGAFRALILNAPFMAEEMAARAEHGADYARSIAPVDDNGPHPGRYRDSIETDSGIGGGVNGDRAYGTVRATAPESVFVEYGTENNEAHHVMTRTLGEMGR